MLRFYLKRINMITLVVISLVLNTIAHADKAECDSLKQSVTDFAVIESELLNACIKLLSQKHLADILEKAFYARDEDVAIKLVKSGVSISSEDMELIHFAAAGEMPNLIDYLINNDPTLVNKIIKGNGTPLGFASEGGAYLAAKKLIERGADINIGLPVVWAIQYGHLHIATMLIEEQLKKGSFSDEQSAEIIGAALMSTSEVAYLYFLLEKGFEPNQFNNDGVHVLAYTISHEDPLIGKYNWKYWVKHGADPELFICNLKPEEKKRLSKTSVQWASAEFNKYSKLCSN